MNSATGCSSHDKETRDEEGRDQTVSVFDLYMVNARYPAIVPRLPSVPESDALQSRKSRASTRENEEFMKR